MNPSAAILELKELRICRGGVPILEFPSFSLGQDQFLSLIGPNGAGKSTLLLAILGLIKAEKGRIWYRGRELASDADRLWFRRQVALVLQEPLLFEGTVYDNVASGLKIRGLKREEIARRVGLYLERFKLTGLAQRSARKLSGGEARRVSLARAFAVEPELIFLDEPFTNLDLPTRQALTEDLDRVIRERGIGAILVTHDQSEALRMSNRVVVLGDGRIVQDGTPGQVMNRPANEFVAGFVGMEAILEGVVLRNEERLLTIEVNGQELGAIGEFAPGAPVYCCIRPENVTVSLANPSHKTSARNVFAARIRDIVSMGPFLKLNLDCGFPLAAYVTIESCTELGLAPGVEVFAALKATAVHLLAKR